MFRATFAVLTTACLLAPLAADAQQLPPGPPSIVTQGEATVKRAPDRAWISVSTDTRDGKAAEARRKNAETMTAVQSALKAAGVAPDAIRTVFFSMAPEMEWIAGRSTMKGYVVRNEIEVRVDDLEKVGDVLDAINAPKGAVLTINGPRFDLKNQQAAEGEALRQAVETAMARAQAIAAGARRALGAILRIEEHGDPAPMPPRPMPMMAARAAQDGAVPTPVTPGDLDIRAAVTLTVEIR